MAHRALQLLANEPAGLVNDSRSAAPQRRIGDMKAIFIRRYGGPEVLEYGEFPDPVVGRETSWSRSPRRPSTQSTSWSGPV